MTYDVFKVSANLVITVDAGAKQEHCSRKSFL